jgi:hypothetical protein
MATMMDSIEYTLTSWEPREVLRCTGTCKRFRHRTARPGLLPAICCGKTARLWDRYEQPVEVDISESITEPNEGPTP